MENWFESIIHRLLPKDPLRKAVQYCMERWAKLKAYLKDGAIEIDNNPVENQIRPVALGRKNYLFSGSHESAQHVAMMLAMSLPALEGYLLSPVMLGGLVEGLDGPSSLALLQSL